MKKILVKKENGEQLVINFGIRETNYKRFSITGDLYNGGGRTDKYFICGGAIHDEILAERPDLKPIVDLHLCDESGEPMHAIENGWYFLTNSKYGKEVVMKHLRIDEETYNKLRADMKNNPKRGKELFTVFVVNQYERWKQEADEVKKFIESFN